MNIAVPVSGFLARLGDGMRTHASLIRKIQWVVILFYAVLLIVPPFLDLPSNHEHMLDNLVVFAQFIFWGLWWPFVLLSMVFFGRLWCGVLCPEGSLSEWSSKHGRNGGTPRWIRWGGWPFLAFCMTTLYGQLISVYDYAQAALLILGGSTVAAMLVGYFYGRGKRVWCRYLCPVSGVFSLLARLAPVHFRVDEQAWVANKGVHLPVPNCAPLIDIRRMKGNSACHACGRCSGQRDAVKLSVRSVNEEIVVFADNNPNKWDIRLLLFGVIGLALGAFTWTVSPWFISLKQTLAEWCVDHDMVWLLEHDAPWWVFTNYPQNNDVFNLLDGLVISGYILGSAVVIGGLLTVIMSIPARITGQGKPLFLHLAQALIPLGGVGLFLGLSATTVKLLRYEGFLLNWVQPLRAVLLVGALIWTLYLGWKVLRQRNVHGMPLIASYACLLLACAPIVTGWWFMFWGW